MDLKIDLNSLGEIQADGRLLAICENVIYEINPRFYYDSKVSRKICQVFTDEQLQKYNSQMLRLEKQNTVVLFNLLTKPETLVKHEIKNLQHFYRFIVSADFLTNNFTLFQDDILLTGFLSVLKKKYQKEWENNKEILHNTDTISFNKIKFENVRTTRPDYDVSSASVPEPDKAYIRPCKIKSIPIDHEMLNQEELNHLIELLFRLNMINLAYKLTKVLLISIENSYLMFKCSRLGKLVELFPDLSRYMFYAFRVLHLLEISNIAYTKFGDNYLFNLAEMLNLPKFEFGPDIPYYPLLVKEMYNLIRHPTEPCFLKGRRGIYPFNEIMKRMEIYSSGALKNLDLKHTAIVGSIIPSCVIRN